VTPPVTDEPREEVPPCPDSSPPVDAIDCTITNNILQCRWGDNVASQALSCPTVKRDPYPRGLVGVPNTFEIQSCDSGTVAYAYYYQDVSQDDPPPSPVKCPPPARLLPNRNHTVAAWVKRSILTVSYMCQVDNTIWNMDERSYNIGKTSDDIVSPYVGHNKQNVSTIMNNDLTIKGERIGKRVSHIYETNSFDKPLVGPGWPDLDKPAPAYQVRARIPYKVRTYAFYEFQYRERVCYKEEDGKKIETSCLCRKTRSYGFCGRCDGWEGPADTEHCEMISKFPFEVQKERLVYAGSKEFNNLWLYGIQPIESQNPQNLRCDFVPVPVFQIQGIVR
jgi:hypothetical protein